MLCLKVDTDSAWADEALRDLDRVLVDHAHCEMKAASNALSLAARHPDDLSLVRALTDLAREEIDHFQRVIALLAERGLTLGPPVVDTYAADLRRAASAIPTTLSPLVDRLLVGALIEARSCERFKLLVDALARTGGGEMMVLYKELLAAEARHFRTFVDLATTAALSGAAPAGQDDAGAKDTRAAVLARLDVLADCEAVIVRRLARAPAGSARAAIHG